jgi:hypothetical protein
MEGQTQEGQGAWEKANAEASLSERKHCEGNLNLFLLANQ